MFMWFYYYRNSKCLGRAVSGAEKDLNLALIGHCGYFHFSLWQLELLFCGQFTEVLRYSADTSRAQSCQTLVLIICKLAGCPLNVQPANLHNFFSRFKARHAYLLHPCTRRVNVNCHPVRFPISNANQVVGAKAFKSESDGKSHTSKTSLLSDCRQDKTRHLLS